SFCKRCAREVGDFIGIDWREIDFEEFYMGINVELEHGTRFGAKTNVTNNDSVFTGRIALAHLLEIPDYYTRLEIMERDAEKKMRKHKNKHKRQC
ncbi:MAG: hypothetical protein H7Y18_07995, partial [Clostridiaceae bacterium]|nr:hypothetical protein [Clostridiaceae bacterium]